MLPLLWMDERHSGDALNAVISEVLPKIMATNVLFFKKSLNILRDHWIMSYSGTSPKHYYENELTCRLEVINISTSHILLFLKASHKISEEMKQMST